ncbi:MAG TPA: hypothetical protein VKD67_05275 [Acidimicrobiales bacterium]|nr:hypothetical protein [Acidimicrobiales bacterium]
MATVARSDGGPEVTYSGHPLDRYVDDMAPGDVNGQGLADVVGQWLVVSPAGFEVATQPSSSGSTGC